MFIGIGIQCKNTENLVKTLRIMEPLFGLELERSGCK